MTKNPDHVRIALDYDVIAGLNQGYRGVCIFQYHRATPMTVLLRFPDRAQAVCRRFLAEGITEGYDGDPEFAIQPVKAGVALTFFYAYQVVLFAHDDLFEALAASWRVVERDREDEVFDLDAALASLLKTEA